MAVPTGYILMRDSLITVNAVQYANQVRKARLVPDQKVQTYKTLVPDGIIQDAEQSAWTLELEGLQINATGGLAKALRTANGTVIPVIIQPKVGTGQDIATVNVLVLDIPFGGEQGEFMTIDISFPCTGNPTYSVAP
jgi:hypothetical protein